MDDAIVNALMGETVVHSNPMGTVTRNCLVVRDDTLRNQVVIGIQSIKEMRKVNWTNPALLVVSAGLFTISAAAYSSHEGYEVSVAVGLIGLLCFLSYFATRRATVLFLLENQRIESKKGSYRDAMSIIRAVERMSGGKA